MDETNDDAPLNESALETLLTQGDTPSSEPSEPFVDPGHISRFVVLRRVGEGGMGVVYAAYDNELERRVAIKLVHARVKGNTGARIRREAQALARLSHPNVVHVYEVGNHEGKLFVAMEYITGPTLAAWAKAQPPSPTRWRQVLDAYIQVGRGLAAAHAARIVHRDFKPANAIVGEDGRVRVLDFGIARSADAEASSPNTGSPPPAHGPDESITAHTLDETLASEYSGETSDPLATPLTQTGALMGTPAYMSPEQFERRVVGPASDQFSFCIALWEALYGVRPFAGRNPAALMVSVLNGLLRTPPVNAEVPSWVHQILLRGLETAPEDRWPSMEALLDALGRDPARRRRRRLRRAGLAAVVTALVAGSAWFANVQRRDTLEAERVSREAQRLEALAAAREIEANAARDLALVEAQANAIRARDTARVLAASDFGDQPELANALLREVERPEDTKGWDAAALEALQVPAAERVFSGHQGRVVYLDVSPDGEWIASSGFDKSARLWSRDGKTAIAIPHPDHVLSAAFDPSGTRLLTAGRDALARIWTLDRLVAAHAQGEQAEPDLVLRGHEDMLWSASWSHDGTRIVTSARDQTARVWSGEGFTESRSIAIPGNVWWAEFSPDDRWIAASSSRGSCKVWSVEDPARPVIELGSHEASVGDVHFSPTNHFLVTASVDGKIRVFRHDPETGPSPTPHAVLDHEVEVYRLRFSREGLRLISSSRDRRAKLWTFDALGNLHSPAKVMAPNTANVVWSSDISPDGRLAAVGVADGTTELWPLEGGPPVILRGHVSGVFRVRFSPDGRTLYTGSNDGTIRVWDMDLSRSARDLVGHRGPIHRLAAAGPLLASSGADGQVRLWSGLEPGTEPAVSRAPTRLGDHASYPAIALGGSPHLVATADEDGPRIRVWTIRGTLVREPQRPLVEFTLPRPDGVRSLAFDPSASLLAAASVDGHVYVWRLGDDPSQASPTPLELAHHFLQQSSMTRVAFTPDGQTLVSAGGDGLLEAWSSAALEAAPAGAPPEPRVFRGHQSRIYNLAFPPEGHHVASTSLDHTVRYWDLDAPTAKPQVFEHGDMVVSVDVDPSGTLLAAGGADTKTYVWDLGEGGRSRVLGEAGGEIRDVAFSPDGDYLASASTDGHLRLWPLAGGAPFVLETEGSLEALHFTSDGRRIAASGSSDVIKLWYLGDLSRSALQQRLVDSTRACLDAEQRMEFIGESPEVARANADACRAG